MFLHSSSSIMHVERQMRPENVPQHHVQLGGMTARRHQIVASDQRAFTCDGKCASRTALRAPVVGGIFTSDGNSLSLSTDCVGLVPSTES